MHTIIAWTVAIIVVGLACAAFWEVLHLEWNGWRADKNQRRAQGKGYTPPPPANIGLGLVHRRLVAMEQLRCYTQVIGDGHSTRFRVTHNLGTRDCAIMIHDKDGFPCRANVLWNNGNTVDIETGIYTGVSTTRKVGPFTVPRLTARPTLKVDSIPKKDSLKVTVVG